ncbi:hypothetical protein NMK34_23865 [Micromonospora sp. BRA006-A]|uniref:hypothetical protein n=1 Tax=Micromonospora sp. BRA006-A TaxID=2962860 RepID=UPI00296E9750|nr:hypothetical protein [Micromonospora sp. BRA006-A]MDW3849655.1 hypothetical protein [Micromonospora sp. BRA006-A]
MARIQIALRVEMEDGAVHNVVADQRDVARWEVQDFGCLLSEIDSRSPMLALRWLAWSAMSRRGLLSEVDGKPMTWEQFDEVCVEAADPEESGEAEFTDPDPGLPVPSEATLSLSPGAPGSH